MRTFHILTGEYPPHAGGVGDYARLVAQGLALRGCTVHVWCPGVAPSHDAGVHLHCLPDQFGPASRHDLDAAIASAPGCVLLQYVPNAIGARGANLPFCVWMLRLRRRRADVRVMFHEPYFYFSWGHPLGNALAVSQRVMAAVLLRAARVAYLSTLSWVRYLRPWSSSATPLIVLPVPATIATAATPHDVAKWRERFVDGAADASIVGHFGTFGDHVANEVEPFIRLLLDAHPTATMICMGRGSDAFVARVRAQHPAIAARVAATGAISSDELAAALRACDVVVQPYPDGVTTRRTSVMAALANGAAIVTTTGALTEPVWSERGAVALIPAGQPQALVDAVIRLLRDPGERARLARVGQQTYDAEFALDRTLDVLLQVRPEPACA